MQAGCGSQQFGDGEIVDVHQGQTSFMSQHPSMQNEGFVGQGMHSKSLFQERDFEEFPQETFDEFPQFHEEDGLEEIEMPYSEEHMDEKNTRSFLIPFKITVVPEKMTNDYVTWKVKDQFPKPFGRPGNNELSDQCMLKRIDLMDVHHDFPDELAVQVSMKESKIDESLKNDPESPEGERTEGQMHLGSYKKMPVHYTLRPNVEKEIPISENRGNYTQSFLDRFNKNCESSGQAVWNEEDLRNKGVTKSLRGNLLVERIHPIVPYIKFRYPEGSNIFQGAGQDHISIGQKAFNILTNSLINEAASNIKLKDVRENLRIFVMRPIKNEGEMSESTWLADEGFTDNVTGTPSSIEAIKNRKRNQKYTISGKLGLSYLPLRTEFY